MDRYGEKPKFEVKDTIGQTPFERKAAGAFFAKWCEVNDSIVPVVVDRKEWEEKTKDGILQKNDDKKHTLYLPKDLRLWEMVGIMEAVDTNTFATNPERQTEVKEKMLDLGKTFQNVGVYMAKRVDGIGEGKEIAEALAVELYDYGQSLVSGKKAAEGAKIEDLAKRDLSEEETMALDHFLAGDSLVEAREKKAIKRGMGVEAMRQKTLNQFFRVAQKAFELSDKSALWELKENPIKLEPWLNDAPIHETFLAKIYTALERNIEMPKTELHASIFRRGMELLRSSMPFDSLPDYIKIRVLHLENGEKTLREALGVEQMKAELEEVRKNGDLAMISEKECKMADRIQRAVSNYQYKDCSNNPSEIILNQKINCVGSSMLGSVSMSEVGLCHLVVNVPMHSILFLATSDGRIMWRDMQSPGSNEELKDEMIEGNNEDGSPMRVKDIVEFARNPNHQGLSFDLGEKYKNKFYWVKNGERGIVIFAPEQGLRQQTLNNMAVDLNDDSKSYGEALETAKQALALSPKSAIAYDSLGNINFSTHNYKDAVKAYQQAIKIDPKYGRPYFGLGNSLFQLGLYELALGAYSQAVVLNPLKALYEYGLGNALKVTGRNSEAIIAYERFLELAGVNTPADVIKLAKRHIEELKKKI